MGMFKVVKDCIFDHVLAYNVTQLLDPLVTCYDQYKYMERHLLDFANGRYSVVLLKQTMPAATAVNLGNTADDGDGCFTVPREIKPVHKSAEYMPKAFAAVSLVLLEFCANTCLLLCAKLTAVLLWHHE